MLQQDTSKDAMIVEVVSWAMRDAAQSVVYRAGADTFDPLTTPFVSSAPAGDKYLIAAKGEWRPAYADAWTSWHIPRQGAVRRRWIYHVFQDSPEDLAKPAHERPQLVKALQMTFLLPGGLIIPDLADLGNDPVQRAAIVTMAIERSGVKRSNRHHNYRDAPVGTLTIGGIPGNRNRRGVAMDEHGLAAHTSGLEEKMKGALQTQKENEDYATERSMLAELMKMSVGALYELSPGTKFSRPLTSPIFPDLSVDAAADLARKLNASGASRDRIWQILQLYGFANQAEKRCWNDSNVAKLGY
jgi:hypothetical protein